MDTRGPLCSHSLSGASRGRKSLGTPRILSLAIPRRSCPGSLWSILLSLCAYSPRAICCKSFAPKTVWALFWDPLRTFLRLLQHFWPTASERFQEGAIPRRHGQVLNTTGYMNSPAMAAMLHGVYEKLVLFKAQLTWTLC